MDSIDENSLFDGQLVCSQNSQGYRFSIDSILLAHFVSVRSGDKILDLGTGSGVISLILLYRHSQRLRECSGVELQESLMHLAKSNMERNGYFKKNTLYHCDVKELKTRVAVGSYDSIVCNPPFYTEKSGRLSRNDEARIARHQITADLNDFLKAASYAVKNRGNVFFIYPAELLTEFLRIAHEHKLELKNIRFVHSYPESEKDAQLALLHCCKNGGPGVKVAPPLYIYSEKNGSYSAEVSEYYMENGDYSNLNPALD